MTVYFNGAVTTTIVPPFDHVNDDNGGPAAAIVTSPVRRAGSHAIRLTRTGSNSNVTLRVEVGTNVSSTPHSNSSPDEAYYGCSVYFPAANSGKWSSGAYDGQNVWQWITRRGDGSTFQALGYFYVNTGDWGITSPHLNFEWNENPDGSISDRGAGHWDLGIIPYDTWIDLVAHFKWNTSSSQGLVEVWKNGALQFSQTCRTYPPDGTIYTEMQNYRHDNNTGDTVNYFDHLLIGDSFAAVDPAGGGVAPPVAVIWM